MAEGWGGYREPTNAAPVSGPGALSQRTDGPLRGSVPGAAAPGGAAAPAPPGPDPSQLTPFGAPSERANEPITAGAPFGEGPGASFGVGPTMDPKTAERLKSYLPVLILAASSEDADSATKQFVRQLRAELG